MIQMLKRAAAQVPAATQNRVKLFINEDGELNTINESGVINSVGGSGSLYGTKIPLLSEIPQMGLMFFNTLCQWDAKFNDFGLIICTADDKQVPTFLNEFLVPTVLYWLSGNTINKNAQLNNYAEKLAPILTQVGTAHWEITMETNISSQNYFIPGDSSETRVQYDLLIDLLRTYAQWFNPNIQGTTIPPQNLYFFNYNSEAEISLIESNMTSDFMDPLGRFYGQRRREIFAELIMQYVYILEFGRECSNFLAYFELNEALAVNRNNNQIALLLEDFWQFA
jgi:hypothetical protein